MSSKVHCNPLKSWTLRATLIKNGMWKALHNFSWDYLQSQPSNHENWDSVTKWHHWFLKRWQLERKNDKNRTYIMQFCIINFQKSYVTKDHSKKKTLPYVLTGGIVCCLHRKWGSFDPFRVPEVHRIMLQKLIV